MDFHDHAGTEIAAFVDRLLDRQLEQSRRDLEGVRQAVGLAAESLATAPGNRPPIEPSEMADIVARLTAAADARARSAAESASHEATATLDQLRADLDQQIETNTELTASLVRARAHAETLESELRTQQEHAEAARAGHLLEIEAVRMETEGRTTAALEDKWLQTRQLLTATRGELTQISDQLQREATDKATLAAALSEAHRQLQAMESEREELTTQLADRASLVDQREQTQTENDRVRGELKDQLDRTLAAEVMLRQQLEEALREVSHARAEAETAMQAAADSAMALYDVSARSDARRQTERLARRRCAVKFTSLVVHQLFVTFQRLAKEPTVWSVLTASVAALSRSFSRVALFTIKGNRLQSVHQVGFDVDIATIALPIGVAHLLGQAAASGRTALLMADARGKDKRVCFGRTPVSMVALPIVGHGKVFGIVYADDVDLNEVDSKTVHLRIACAEVLMEYVSGVLLQLLIKRQAGAEVPLDRMAAAQQGAST